MGEGEGERGGGEVGRRGRGGEGGGGKGRGEEGGEGKKRGRGGEENKKNTGKHGSVARVLGPAPPPPRPLLPAILRGWHCSHPHFAAGKSLCAHSSKSGKTNVGRLSLGVRALGRGW